MIEYGKQRSTVKPDGLEITEENTICLAMQKKKEF